MSSIGCTYWNRTAWPGEARGATWYHKYWFRYSNHSGSCPVCSGTRYQDCLWRSKQRDFQRTAQRSETGALYHIDHKTLFRKLIHASNSRMLDLLQAHIIRLNTVKMEGMKLVGDLEQLLAYTASCCVWDDWRWSSDLKLFAFPRRKYEYSPSL